MRAFPVAVWVVCFASGCFTAPTNLSAANGGVGGGAGGSTRRGASGGEANGGTSGGSGTSGQTGGGSGGGSTGSTGAANSGSTGGAPVCMGYDGGMGSTILNCAYVPPYTGDAGSCSAGWFGSVVLDFESCQPICGATVVAQDTNGVPIPGTSELSDPVTGTFHFCVPSASTVFETAVSAPGYPTFVYGEIQGELAQDIPSFGLLSNEELDIFQVIIPGGLSPAKGALVSFFVSYGACTTQQANWVISLATEDGGSYPDGGYQTLYLDSQGVPQPGLTATSPYGVALLFDIDPSVATFPTLVATNPDAGCQVANTRIGFTGRVQVGEGLLSEQGLFLQQ